MKLYIFITFGLHEMGGGQMYVNSKALWLQKQGWNTIILSPGKEEGWHSIFTVKDNIHYFPELYLPIGLYSRRAIKTWLKKAESLITTPYTEIVIESSNECFASWGEYLAKQLSAKHFVYTLNERFRNVDGANINHYDTYYNQYFKFFDFKHKRKELAGIHEDSLSLLFEKHKIVSENERYFLKAIHGGAVQDIQNSALEQLKRYDWNICSIGRLDKEYVPTMLEGVLDFAMLHSDKIIQFVIVSEIGLLAESRLKILDSQSNIIVTRLGTLSPIPRSLFSKIDVVLASSGCAAVSALESVPTLSIDAKNYLINGVLGYTTKSTLFHSHNDAQMNYVQALEEALIVKSYKTLEFSFDKPFDIENEYAKHMAFLAQSEPKKEYYPILKIRCVPAVYYGKFFAWFRWKCHDCKTNFKQRIKKLYWDFTIFRWKIEDIFCSFFTKSN